MNNVAGDMRNRSVYMRNPIFEPMIFIPYLIGIAIALFWPEEGLHIAWLEGSIDFVANKVPSIIGYSEKSKFPNVSKFYFSASSIVFFSWLIFCIKNPGYFLSMGFEGQFERIKGKSMPIFFCLIALIFFTFVLFALWRQPGYQLGVMPINEKRWALAAFGPLSSFFCGLYILFDILKGYSIYLFRLINR